MTHSKDLNPSQVTELLQNVDPATLERIAFGLGADYWVYSAATDKLAARLVDYFFEHGRLADLVAQVQNAPDIDPELTDQLQALSLPIGPAYRLWEIKSRSGAKWVDVDKTQKTYARWFQLKPGDGRITLLGGWRKRGRAFLLVGIPETQQGRDGENVRRAVQRNEFLRIRPFSSLREDRRDRWQSLVLRQSGQGDTRWYRLSPQRTFHGPAWFRRRVWATIALLALLFLSALWVYPRLVAWLDAARAQTQAAWTSFSVQMSKILRWVARALWSVVRGALLTAAALGLLGGLTLLVFRLQRSFSRQKRWPPVWDMLAGLESDLQWLLLSFANWLVCTVAFLVVVALSRRPLTVWDCGVPIALALGIEFVGIPWLLDQLPSRPGRATR